MEIHTPYGRVRTFRDKEKTTVRGSEKTPDGGEKRVEVRVVTELTVTPIGTGDLVKKYRAGDLVKELSKTLGGRGGGKPELAQAGGGDPAQLDAALARAYEIV